MADQLVKLSGGEKLERYLAASKDAQFEVEAGYFETAKYLDGTPVPAVAVWHEFGVNHPKAKIPARPTFRPAIHETRKRMNDLVNHVLRGEPMNPAKKLKELAGKTGELFTGILKKNIKKITEPPLSERTLKIRRSRKINRTNSTKPLVDTGTLSTAATYQVWKKR